MLATGSLALIAAVFHHFVAQAPKQATLSKTFYVFATLIAIFLLIRLRSTRPHPPASGQLCSDLFKFINIYVRLHFQIALTLDLLCPLPEVNL